MPTEDVTPRVKVVHAQARAALRLAAAFALAAAAAVVVPHRTGAWLPLHLFLVGTLLLAISAATRLFTVTWSASDPVAGPLVAAQRWLVALGAAGLAIGRERSLPTAALALAGVSVTTGLVLLGGLLAVEARRARVRRYHPAVHAYLVAVAAGVVGTGLGAAMVTGRAGLRDAHVIVNVLGLVGLVVAGTLPFFTATQARMKMHPRATPRRLHANLLVLAASVAVAATGAAVGRPGVVAVGLAGYAGGLVHLATTVPRPGRKQLRWAGPRLAQLGAGFGWWTATVAAAAGHAATGRPPFPEATVGALVIGGYLQILLASLAYLGPVLRAGGHVRLTAGFATTRSWLSFVAGNVAASAWVAGATTVARGALVLVAVDTAIRAVALARTPRPARTAGADRLETPAHV
jgi:nitrite reductase (NO-forming)